MNLTDLGKKELIKILNYFLDNPKEISQTGLLKKIKLSKATVIKWVSFLEKEKILKIGKIGNTKLLSLDNDLVIIKQLKLLQTERNQAPISISVFRDRKRS